MATKKWLTENHVDILARTLGFRRQPEWTRDLPGNARSRHLLRKLGLLESRCVTGPRGGKYTEIRLTAEGFTLLRSVQDTIEGTGEQDTEGNQVRTLSLSRATFTWGYL